MDSYGFYKYFLSDRTVKVAFFFGIEVVEGIEYYKTFNFIEKGCVNPDDNNHAQISYLPLLSLDKSSLIHVAISTQKHRVQVFNLSNFIEREKRIYTYRFGMTDIYGIDEKTYSSDLTIDNQFYENFLKVSDKDYFFR